MAKTETIEQELIRALRDLLKAYESVLPGIRYIAVQDYRLINEAPIAATKAIQRAEAASGQA